MNVRLDFAVTPRSIGFTGDCDRKSLLVSLQLVIAYLSDARFEERALLEARASLGYSFLSRTKSPWRVCDDQYEKFIFGNDSIFGLPDESAALSVQMDDVKRILLTAFQNEAKNFTIIGDFDLEEAIQNIQDTFGSLPLHSPSPNSLYDAEIVHFPKEMAKKTFHFTGDERTALSILTFLTDDCYNIKDGRALGLLRALIDNRLHDKLRKTEGKVYSHFVQHRTTGFKHFGLFEIMLDIHPDSIYETKNETLAILNDLKTAPVSAEELDRALRPLLNSHRSARKTNNFWLNMLTSASLIPNLFDHVRSLLPTLENMTAETLLETARKYFRDPVHTMILRAEPNATQMAAESRN
jgi:zinc protease